jgi:hypothetical protein
MSRVIYALAAMLALLTSAAAHDGVALEKDSCVVKTGPLSVHFSAYQRYGEEQEDCADIARTGPTVFGLTPVQTEYRDWALGLKIINERGEAVVSVSPHRNPNGILTVERDITVGGNYTVIVTARDPSGKEYSGKMPITIGLATVWNKIEYILYALGFVGFAATLWALLRRPKEESFQPAE